MNKTFAQVYKTNFLGHWGKINDIKKPIIAAVNGFAVCVFFLISFFFYIL
jgi:enoyl-CoA hydratase